MAFALSSVIQLFSKSNFADLAKAFFSALFIILMRAFAFFESFILSLPDQAEVT